MAATPKTQLVAAQRDLETRFFGYLEKFAIFQPRPTHIADRENLMAAEPVSQTVWQVFIEQHFHGTGCPRRA